MSQSTLCVSVPEELKSFCKNNKTKPIPIYYPSEQNFGIKIVRKKNGEVDYTAHYSDTGELIKKSYYDGTSITRITYFRNNIPFCTEDFKSERILRKTYFNTDEKIKSEILYKYFKDNIVSIQKFQSKNKYEVIYGYDELDRINSRILKINDITVNEQKYSFDILDRLIEYSDYNQRVKVLQISPANQLIYYKITDKIGNEISVINNFNAYGYKCTEMSLNGHKISITDRNYVDNIMLKKPYASEDDLDLIIANLLNNNENCRTTKRSGVVDITNQLIQDNIKIRVLPISIRKRVLYNMSLNAS
ncbi:hypothetical protein IKQ21_00725 [bacterium]|nr:hypothetical protein [bacterium]